MQSTGQIKPLFLNMDTAYEELKPTESPFIKNMTWDINGNPNAGIGTDNGTGNGQNMLALTPVQSNEKFLQATLPAGYNLNRGYFESITTQELYYFNYNSNGNHGIYVIDGNTNQWNKVIEDPNLQFTDNQDNYMASHRVTLRAVYDSNKNIVEKHLIITDGNSWQKWVNVIASIKTNGFDALLFPYWKLQPPHFDRRELMEFAPRPPMYKPEIVTLPNTIEDKGKINTQIDKAFQFCYAGQYTDGRTTTVSPYSLPLIVNSTEYISNPDNIPKKSELTLYAGSCMYEKIYIYVREAVVQDGTGSDIAPEWGNWHLYDVINKFSTCGANDPQIIGNEYWRRTDQWAEYSYDQTFNTIKYIFDNSKVSQIVSQDTVNMLFSGMPLRSVAQSDLGDAILYGNNEFGYDNLPCEVMDKFDAIPVEGSLSGCPNLKTRKISLYAYVGRERGNFSGSCDPGGADNSGYDFQTWISQVGYFNGTNTQMKFGGFEMEPNGTFSIHECESDYFNLNFSDKNAFRCYLKGTPFFADGEWYWVDTSFELKKIDGLLDISLESTRAFIKNVYQQGGFFVCRFDFNVPAGKYIATLDRHSLPSSNNSRSESTYITGIANSRTRYQRTLSTGFQSQSINVINGRDNLITKSKEIEVDCTDVDINVWGNGRDLFYVFCPSFGAFNNKSRFSFIEGYLRETRANNIPFEQMPYNVTGNAQEAWGFITDKNGHFFGFVANDSTGSDENIVFNGKLNCIYPKTFIFNQERNGSVWSRDNLVYITDYNNGVVGDCNRVVVRGRITDLSGSIGYSNIAVSIVDGSTSITNNDGTFQLIVHNGTNTNRFSNIYINSAGNFNIAGESCAPVPLTYYSDINVPCISCTVRNYPFDINMKINIITGNQRSVKQGGKYSVGGWVADLAGRMSYANIIKEVYVPSFLERDNTLAYFIRLLINSPLLLNQFAQDAKWFFPCVSKNISEKRYVQWVGDKIQYIDNSGNITDTPNNAVFCKIFIQSLYDFNINNNFSVLAKYQFVKGDRLQVFDDGDGNLFDIATYGEPIDIQVLGTNYNQAAINAGLLPPESNTVLNPNTATESTDVGLIVKYDARLDKLASKTGFWIEIYTPSQTSDIIPLNECAGGYPIIDGTLQEFTGYVDNIPQYRIIDSIDLSFWDTYLINRNISIAKVGSKAFGHPFESPNVTDSFGANLASGGRINTKNDNAKQRWVRQGTIKSDEFVSGGIINGLANFRSANAKEYSDYKWGGIVAIHPERNLISFICENDFFTTDYNFHYAFPNAQGQIVTNLDNGLSEAHQKVGSNYGCNYENTGTIIIDDKYIYWYDAKNTAFIKMNYGSAIDLTSKSDSEQGGVQSYINSKTEFVSKWNNAHTKEFSFDVVAGIDAERGFIFLTFRPRRGNENSNFSYVNERRNIQLDIQETIVYDIQYHGWGRFVGFTPESYGRLRGKNANVEMYSFAAGIPYMHNNTSNASFLNFFGMNTERVIICAANTIENKEKDVVKVFQSLANDVTGAGWFIDMIYNNETNSYSYIPSNFVKTKEHNEYAGILRDMSSYPPIAPEELFRCMLHDGKRLFGNYIIFRMVGDPEKPNEYCQMKNIYYTFTQSPSSIKK